MQVVAREGTGEGKFWKTMHEGLRGRTGVGAGRVPNITVLDTAMLDLPPDAAAFDLDAFVARALGGRPGVQECVAALRRDAWDTKEALLLMPVPRETIV